MDPIQLGDLAARHARWLTTMQMTSASNIANAGVADYKAREVEDFSAILDAKTVQLTSTHAQHFGVDPTRAGTAATFDVSEGEMSVALESELATLSQVRTGYEMNTAIVTAFHRMFIQSATAP